jgi:ubiquinone/menaquinone biosynthesis C-methylase UbiE
MNVAKAYNNWAEQYDTNENKTRDLEAISLRSLLKDYSFENCLEIGCGTGKNTAWLLTKAASVLAVDLSEEMLAKAKEKIQSEKVQFVQANILEDWSFAPANHFDIATFSLVLEHIENLSIIFQKLNKVVKNGGYVYIGELHPFKQYTGSKARFETAEGMQVVTCFNHHVSDFTEAARQNGFIIETIQEFFDDAQRSTIPRILAMRFRK